MRNYSDKLIYIFGQFLKEVKHILYGRLDNLKMENSIINIFGDYFFEEITIDLLK